MLLDDDDTLEPHAIETLLRILLTFPDAAAAYCDHTFTDLSTGEHYPNHHSSLPSFACLRQIPPIRIRDGVRLYGKALHYRLLNGNVLQQPWMVWRDKYLEIGGFESELGSADDWDLYLRITRRYSVALSDDVVGHHFVESGRQHLTKSPGQDHAQIRAIRRQLQFAQWYDWRARLLLRRRLAAYYKGFGDEARGQSLRIASSHYRKSFALWPFDHVVCARAAVWTLGLPFLTWRHKTTDPSADRQAPECLPGLGSLRNDRNAIA